MSDNTKKVALVGANGMLGQMVQKVASEQYEIIPLILPEFDITDRNQVLRTLSGLRPQIIVNCAAYTNVDGCETNEEEAYQVNGVGPGYLAKAAVEVGATLVHVSTDYVFSGDSTSPYSEGDPTGPISAYGRSKLAGEQEILSSGLTNYFIVRTSWLYGPGGKNFVETILKLAGEREELRIVADQFGSPTYTGDLAIALFNLLESAKGAESYGTYHFSNEGSCSWYEFAERIVSLARSCNLPVKVERLLPIATEDYPLPAKRPSYSVFSKLKYEKATGGPVPSWQDSLNTYFTVRQTWE